MKKLFVILTSCRFLMHWLYFRYTKNRSLIDSDLNRNLNQFIRFTPLSSYKKSTFIEFCFLMTFYKMFRNIFYARVGNRHHYYAKFLSLFAHPQPLLDISESAEIGGGLIVQHGYGTIIDPKKMGENCWVNQGVTIGYTNDTDAPYIGNDVIVYAGAKIIGNVTIGDKSIIGANAVVVKDVEKNSIVGGVPAKLIKINDKDY